MSNFKKRSTENELMDTETISFVEFKNCLRHLEIINIFSFAYRPTYAWLKKSLKGISHHKSIAIFDVGSGGGDMLRQIWKWTKKWGIQVSLTGIDANPWSKKSAEEFTSPDLPITFKTSDIFKFNPIQPPDFIISSLFTHHLTEHDLITFIQWMDKYAIRGWFVNDLHRHCIPYFFIKYATCLMPVNRIVRHDAPISVARSFTIIDWYDLLKKAGIPKKEVYIKWFFPFRYGIARNKP